MPKGRDILRHPGAAVAAVVVAGLGMAGCGAGRGGGGEVTLNDTPDTTAPAPPSATAEATTPPTTTTQRAFAPIVGRIAHTKNGNGVKEGTWAYYGPGTGEIDVKKVGPTPLADGSTIQGLCHLAGRTIELRLQSPGLNLDATNDWAKLDQIPGSAGPAWVPTVYTEFSKPLPNC